MNIDGHDSPVGSALDLEKLGEEVDDDGEPVDGVGAPE